MSASIKNQTHNSEPPLNMSLNIQNLFKQIKQHQHDIIQTQTNVNDPLQSKKDMIQKFTQQTYENLNPDEKNRLDNELNGFGPIANLLYDSEITEILINSYEHIYYEKNGQLIQSTDHFFDQSSYHSFVERLCSLSETFINSEKPFVEKQFNQWRLTLVFGALARGEYLVSIRKQPATAWTFNQLLQNQWCTEHQLKYLNHIIKNKENFILVGGTGSGKTSVLQAIIHAIGPNERTVIIEDTQELQPVYHLNTSLLTRIDPLKKLMDVHLNDLVKKALRLRPDRICVGEIRGEESTALLMALATGHDGSFGSLHARTPQEALLRLEMLIQMGAPQWTLASIRKLIHLTLQNIIVVEKRNGQRLLQGIYRLSSLEERGITLHQLDEV